MNPHSYGQHFQQMVLVQLVVIMLKNGNRAILISLYKAQVYIDQEPPHKTRYTESNRRESWEEPQRHGPEENFLNRTPMTYALRSRIDKWDLIKLQSFCEAKNTVNKTKRQPTDWEKIFTNPTSNGGQISLAGPQRIPQYLSWAYIQKMFQPVRRTHAPPCS